MKTTFKLVKVLLKNFEMGSFEKKKSKVFYLTMAIVTMIIIMIPAALMFGIISYGMTSTLMELNHKYEGVNLLLYAISIFSFIFCINVILNIFYFSSDIDCLLPMPLKGEQIIGAKFIASLITENAMQFILIISSLLGYVFMANLPFYSFFIILLAVITVPIIPLVYCSIICMLFMSFTRFIKNGDAVNKISSGLIIVSTLALLILVIVLSNTNIENFTVNLINSKFLNVMNYIFPHIALLTSGMNGNGLNIIYYILINVGALLVFFILAKLLYFKGITNRTGVKGKVKSLKFKEKKPLFSCFCKEIKILFKTPAFFANCVIINFIWPIFIVLLLYLYDKSGNLSRMLLKYNSNDTFVHVAFLLGIIIASILITATNSIASSSLSREGKGLSYMKQIPVSYETQLNAKALCSIIVSGIGLIIYIIIFGIYIKIPFYHIFMYIIFSMLSVVFISYLGLYLDTINPKLVWDDEMNALRGNHNVFINMAISMLISGILLLLIYGLYLIKLNIVFINIISIVLLIFFCFMTYKVTKTKGVKNITKIE